MKTHLKSVGFGFLGFVLAGILYLAGTIAYQDHKYVQVLVQIESQRQNQYAAQKAVPSPTPPTK